MDALDRMFRVLVRTLKAQHPDLLAAPFSVGDLHQHILPYRHFRRDLALESNQEYELVLMELITGARNYLDVDERLRDELGKELRSANPQPSRVREFAECQVSVNAKALASMSDAEAAAPADQAGQTSAVQSGAKTATPADVHRTGGCRYCGGALPSGRMVNYCPHCGQNLQVHNCPACGAELEEGWKFCVACGKGVG